MSSGVLALSRYFSGLAQRLGFLPPTFHSTGAEAVWLHAVSVGEVLTALPLIRRLRREKPFLKIYVSVTTLAGRATADEKLAGLADGVFFAPLDYRSIVRRVLRRLRPHLMIVLETEIWPNLYRESKRARYSCSAGEAVRSTESRRGLPGALTALPNLARAVAVKT